MQYRIGRQTISKLIPEACKAIYDALVAKYINTPLSHEDWLAISQQFEDRWNLPHIAGVLNGKHIRIPLYFTILNAFSAWFCSLYVMQSAASQCLTWASMVARTAVAWYSRVKWAKLAHGSLNIPSGTILVASKMRYYAILIMRV